MLQIGNGRGGKLHLYGKVLQLMSSSIFLQLHTEIDLKFNSCMYTCQSFNTVTYSNATSNHTEAIQIELIVR